MGNPEENLDAKVLAELDAMVAALPPLTSEQLDALCETLAQIRLKATRRQ